MRIARFEYGDLVHADRFLPDNANGRVLEFGFVFGCHVFGHLRETHARRPR